MRPVVSRSVASVDSELDAERASFSCHPMTLIVDILNLELARRLLQRNVHANFGCFSS